MKKERIAYIDFIEFIAVFLVVFCHYTETAGTTVVDNIALQFTTTIAVPLFFMANGALLFSQKFNWKKHLVKIVMLFVSTAVWKLLTLVVVYLDMGYHFHDLTVSYVFQGICGGNFSDPPVPVEHFWFMYELIGIYLLFPLLKGCYDAGRKDILIYIAAICFFFVCVLTEYNAFAGLFADKFGIDIVTLSGSEFPFAKGGLYIIYFIVGLFIHQYSQKLETVNKKVDILLLVVFAVAFGFLLFEKYLQCGTLSGSWVRLDGDYQRIGTLVMAGTFFAFFSRRKFANVKLNKIFEFVSLRSINIYIIHMFLCWAWVIHVYPRIPISNIGMHFVRTVIVVVVAILILEPISLIPGVNTLLGLKNHWKKEIRTSDSKGINKGK